MTQCARICLSLLAAVTVSSAVARAVIAQSPLDAARQSIADFEWSNAIERYTPIQQAAAPGSAEWTEATFCLAVAHHHAQPPDKHSIKQADDLYTLVVEKSKDDRYAARALLARGRILELQDFGRDPIDLDGARRFYEQVMTRYAAQPIAAEAALRAGASLVMAYDAPEFVKVKQGIDLLEKWVAAHPTDPMATMFWQYLGDSYFEPLADYKNALRCYEQVDKLGWIDQGNQGAWYWRIAVMSERYLNDPASAAKYYTKIVKETPNSGKAYEALIALRRMGAPQPSAPRLEDQRTRGATAAATPTAPTTQPEARR